MNKLESLDGIRGMAVLRVVITYIIVWNVSGFSDSYPFLNLGQAGVTIFFVLSSFFMFSILIRMNKNSGNLFSYYIARIFRIVPFCSAKYENSK